MLAIAFKEWAVICRALAQGRQSLILRKGGIAEAQGQFRVEHERFWLFPTYLHQHEAGVIPAAHPLLAETVHTQPPTEQVLLTSFVEVTNIFHLDTEAKALALADLHLWSEATVRQRFHYRQPGLFVLGVRVYNVPTPHQVMMTPYYEGCKSWVTLAEPLPMGEAVPAIPQQTHQERMKMLHQRM